MVGIFNNSLSCPLSAYSRPEIRRAFPYPCLAPKTTRSLTHPAMAPTRSPCYSGQVVEQMPARLLLARLVLMGSYPMVLRSSSSNATLCSELQRPRMETRREQPAVTRLPHEPKLYPGAPFFFSRCRASLVPSPMYLKRQYLSPSASHHPHLPSPLSHSIHPAPPHPPTSPIPLNAHARF